VRLGIPNDFCLNVVVPSQNLIRAGAGPKYNLPFNPLLTTYLRSPNELPPSRTQLSKNRFSPTLNADQRFPVLVSRTVTSGAQKYDIIVRHVGWLRDAGVCD